MPRMKTTIRIDAEQGIVYGYRGKPVGHPTGDGYLKIDQRGRKCGSQLAHRLVWESVYGPIPANLEINHKNGIKTDNRIANLELVTHQENMKHAYALGLKSNAGEKHPSAQLNEEAVREIRTLYRRYSRDANARVLSSRYGVGRKCIADVVSGHTWSHVEEVA